ncbi:MAG: type I-E CRISPR-associated protein Cas5/CasD [Phycisphaerae bacterium]|jgi:CRISPR system Cascade subunit CasD|nr:type I-E CRISPR-associated protein Cas5/CasD [Phycisphaerae bacterium]
MDNTIDSRPNTLFLRLEGPLQAWGQHESKFAIRRTAEAPTKSGIVGLLCAAMGIRRNDFPNHQQKFNSLAMAVRMDSPGIRWWDYHTVGAGMQMQIAERIGKTKDGPLLSRREYLCDAQFLVVLQGTFDFIAELAAAIRKPQWSLYLGRKCCPPSLPIWIAESNYCSDLLSALKAIPYQKRYAKDDSPEFLDCLLDWQPTADQPEAPEDAEVWYDVPVSFDPPGYEPRFVIRKNLSVGKDGDIKPADKPFLVPMPSPLRTRANYQNTEFRKARQKRLDHDQHLCVFCKSPATTVQHITYQRAGGNETQEDLRSMCRLCHDAVTMIEYGVGMGMDRINPEDPQWREKILQKRQEILAFRSLETRRRRLQSEEVE